MDASKRSEDGNTALADDGVSPQSPISTNHAASQTQHGNRAGLKPGLEKSDDSSKSISRPSFRIIRQIIKPINWVPPSCRYNPENPPCLTMPLILLFGFACTFTVANLYYSHPILDILASSFNVSQERASIIPTAAQGGYAAGLLFICPLGDLVKRRPFVLWLMAFTATITLGLCLTSKFETFIAINFIMSVTTVTPQIMLPLVGQLAAPNRRATALSIVVSGLLLGILIARLLSGIIANYSSWRNVYWMSFALQYAILILLWIWMPDYPQTNKHISYFRILYSIPELLLKNPILVQASLIGFLISSTFTSFWTTLTFLLSADPYNYSTVIIGLFALAGMVPMLFGPFFANKFTDRFQTHISVLIGTLVCLLGIAIGTYTGKLTIAGPIIQAVLFDFGQQIAQVANRTAIYGVAPKAANRVNTAYMLCAFCGQLMGTAVGNKLYARGGWVLSGSASVGFMGGAILVLLMRGPRETRWLGWRGGLHLRRAKQQEQSDNNSASELEKESGEKDDQRDTHSNSQDQVFRNEEQGRQDGDKTGRTEGTFVSSQD